MIKKEYICDVCGKSVKKEDLMRLDSKLSMPFSYSYSHLRVEKDICLDCLDERGLTVKDPKGITSSMLKQNQVTLEDRLISILEDVGVKFND